MNWIEICLQPTYVTYICFDIDLKDFDEKWNFTFWWLLERSLNRIKEILSWRKFWIVFRFSTNRYRIWHCILFYLRPRFIPVICMVSVRTNISREVREVTTEVREVSTEGLIPRLKNKKNKIAMCFSLSYVYNESSVWQLL